MSIILNFAVKKDDGKQITCDILNQLLKTHEKYKKDILGSLESLVLHCDVNSHSGYASIFGRFYFDRKRLSLFL